MNIALIAERSAGLMALRTILASNHRLVAVYTSPDDGHSSRTVWAEATRVGVWPTPAQNLTLVTAADELRAFAVEVIINVHSVVLLPQDVREAAIAGAFNLHPGPLPRYAGLNTVCWAIYRGESEFGVTLHKMTGRIDAGPIVDRTTFPILPNDTGLTLSGRCWNQGMLLLERFLQQLSVAPQDIRSQPQDLSQRQYFGRDIPQAGQIDWNLPAQRVHDLVRASNFIPYRSPWGIPRASVRDEEIDIVQTTLTHEACSDPAGTVLLTDSGLRAACADEWLMVESVDIKGKIVRAVDALKDRYEPCAG
jgi:methionyl-tRNA formyltransferase